jgi:hypothetical protein
VVAANCASVPDSTKLRAKYYSYSALGSLITNSLWKPGGLETSQDGTGMFLTGSLPP